MYPGACVTEVSGINDKGDIVGTALPNPSSSGKGFLLVDDQFTDIQFPGAAGTGATAINNRGVIVGDYFDQQAVAHGFILANNQYTSLDFPGAVSTTVSGINDAG